MLFHSSKKPIELQIIHLNKTQKKRQEQIKALLKRPEKKSCFALGKLCKVAKKKKQDKHLEKDSDKHVFVSDFDGDIKASAVNHLREEISTIISTAKQGDEVVLRLESGGGHVSAYGLAASQLARLKEAKIDLTICVDKIAASGGYMMACTADKILASDFALIGSVGVVAQMPNFHDFLKKHDIGFELFTAGEYKRTVTMFGENDDKDREKFQAELNRIHELFQDFVKTHRPKLDVAEIATGEFWFGKDALEKGLIDEIQTSDAYLMTLMQTYEVFALHSRSKPTLAEKLGLAEQLSIQNMVTAVSDATPKILAKITQQSLK